MLGDFVCGVLGLLVYGFHFGVGDLLFGFVDLMRVGFDVALDFRWLAIWWLVV